MRTPERKTLLRQIAEDISQLNSGVKGGILGFVVGLLLVTFGFWRTLFVLFLTCLGYVLGIRLIQRHGGLKELLDKIFPPGFFR